jgi:outer membrane protein TolC
MLIAALLFPGCVMTNPYETYTPVSYPEISAVEAHSETRSAGVPEASINGSLTLEQAIKIAIENNPEISATQWDVNAAGSSLDIALAGRLPTLRLETGYRWYLDDQRLIAARYNGDPGIFDKNILQGDLVVSWPIYTGGRISSEIAAAELIKMSEERRLSRTREELIFNISSTFYAMLAQKELIRSLEFSTNAMEAQRSQVQELMSAQKAARVDLLRTEVRLADLKQRLVREKNILAIEKQLLANLMGVESNPEEFSIEGELDTNIHPELPPEKTLSNVLDIRNDYKSAKALLEARERRVDAARAGHLPMVTVSGSYGERIALSGDNEDTGAIALSMSIPLFEGGSTSAQVAKEHALLASVRERLRKLELQIRLELESSMLDIQLNIERIEAGRRSIEQAEESLRIEQLKYNLGKGSITDVLDAQSAMLSSQTNFYQALSDYRISIAKYRLAAGENI